MNLILLRADPFPKSQIPKKLQDHGISVNPYAEVLFTHPAFSTESFREMRIVITSLREIGLADGGTLDEIRKQGMKRGFRPCPLSTGLFLRMQWTDQPESRNSILTGTHASPDGAVIVLSEKPEADDTFPKGLYLRKVDGVLWLRGYICDDEFTYSGEDLFVFDAGETVTGSDQEIRCL